MAPAFRGACYFDAMVFEPDIVVQSAWNLSPDLLRSKGIDGVLVDLDDTLLPSGVRRLGADAEAWAAALASAGVPVVIVSNGRPDRVRHVSERLSVEGLALAGKPLPIAFLRGVRRLGTAPARTAMVGDQLFTDVCGANLAGLISVLVAPLTPGGLLHTRLARHLERRVLGERAPVAPRPTPYAPAEYSTDIGGDRGSSVDR